MYIIMEEAHLRRLWLRHIGSNEKPSSLSENAVETNNQYVILSGQQVFPTSSPYLLVGFTALVRSAAIN